MAVSVPRFPDDGAVEVVGLKAGEGLWGEGDAFVYHKHGVAVPKEGLAVRIVVTFHYEREA